MDPTLHGLPQDIVPDQGPQFVPKVRKAFCEALGAMASFDSGSYPQTNRQTEHINQDLESALLDPHLTSSGGS